MLNCYDTKNSLLQLKVDQNVPKLRDLKNYPEGSSKLFYFVWRGACHLNVQQGSLKAKFITASLNL